ncbi:hypothetical protein MVEN_02546000 [Mycena venus]|uniref:DUF6532 domain-containing protein n=1 Tax=Mycena venus TaxID=2733690 RepID=A0A8H6U3Z6_9AGAR|nr:hypothetical protein MVEN_02546000 [Mycena venus]
MSTQFSQPRGRSSTRQPSTRHNAAAAKAANKENESVPRDNGRATTKKSRAPTRIESDDDNEGNDHDYHPGAEEPMDDNDDDIEDDDGSPRRGRTRRVSEKKAQLEEERTQAAARKQEKALKAAKAAKKKAGEIEPDTRGPINDDFFTDRTITSTRPTATKNLAQRNNKVPPPPKFPSDDWRASSSTAHRRDSHHYADDDNDYDASHRPSRRSSSPPPVRHTFRGRSPAPKRTPVREPIRNINGGIVPDSVNLHLVHDASSGHQQSSRRRPRSPSLRPLSPRPRSVSPSAGDKRHRAPPGRAAAREPRIWTTTPREFALFAIDHYRCLISTQQPFPDSATETAMVRKAWYRACEEMGEQLPLTPAVAKLISNRGSQLRGELKTKVRPLVELMYGFKTGQNKKSISFNRKNAEDLKDGTAFAFKDAEAKKGLYKHPIFQMAVNAMWFANRRDEGPRHPELFNPLPLESFALILTGVENSIDERLTGTRTDVPFTANDYRSVYEGHLKSLEEFAAHTEKYQILDKILKRLHTVGRFHSGAQPLTVAATSTFTKDVLDAALKEYEDGVTTDDASDAEE